MEDFFINTVGLSEHAFVFVALPLLIFLARVCEVSVNTIRIIYMLGGRRLVATVMGFFEALIWLTAIRQIFQHIDNWLAYTAYPLGFAAGIFVGMIIEDRIAYGKVIMRIIIKTDHSDFYSFLGHQNFRYTGVKAYGATGPENLLFVVLQRERLELLINGVKRFLPEAFYTVESVKSGDDQVGSEFDKSGLKWFIRLRGMIRG